MYIKKRLQIPIGLRTVKTAVAVMIAMAVVESHGATTSKLIFAMLGAMEAVQPTFKDSLKACLTQVVGVLQGTDVLRPGGDRRFDRYRHEQPQPEQPGGHADRRGKDSGRGVEGSRYGRGRRKRSAGGDPALR